MKKMMAMYRIESTVALPLWMVTTLAILSAVNFIF